MKTIQKPFFRVLPMMLLSALCFVSCKPDEPQVENWYKGEWVYKQYYLLEDCTVWICEQKLTFFDKTFTFFEDTIGYAENTTGSYAEDTSQSGITRTGTCWYKNDGVYFTYSDQPEDIFSAGRISDSSIFLHNSPINASVQQAMGRTFYRVKPPLPD